MHESCERDYNDRLHVHASAHRQVLSSLSPGTGEMCLRHKKNHDKSRGDNELVKILDARSLTSIVLDVPSNLAYDVGEE